MNVFLETHNIKNLCSGLGQFNYHLIKGLYNLQEESPNFIINTTNSDKLKCEFGDFFDYNKYRSITRYPLFRVRKKVDLWHSMNQNTRIEPYNNLPYLNTIHDVNFMTETTGLDLKKRKLLFNKKLNRSNAIVYISEFAKKSTHKYFQVPKNIPEYVIYNGNPIINVEEYNFENCKTKYNYDGSPFLFAIGQAFEKKNFHTLVQMMEFLKGTKLVIAGKNNTPYAKRIKDLIVKKNLTNRVFLLGEISEEEKYYYYHNCQAFVFPSLLEGFGIPPIEAMSFGKPVFLSKKTSLPEIGGEHAFYWDNFDPEYMADTIIEGLNVFDQNKTFITNKLKERARGFCWNKAAKEYLTVYNTILNK